MNKLRLLLFVLVAAVHGLAILFVAINVQGAPKEPEERIRVMKLTDIAEYIPPPPENPPPPPPPRPAPPPPDNAVEAIAEEMLETDEEPENQTVVEAGSIVVPQSPSSAGTEEEYLPVHRISVLPVFPDDAIRGAIRYPVIARNSNIQGRVILDLFVDRTGIVRRIDVLREDPPNRGFGDAAKEAFQEVFKNPKIRCKPALANGEPVSVRIRYPVTFRLLR
ncbi:MAG: energy transducer TonB [Treponema sp.]|jgi:protein TonB|nr:energy transducer TonB [Treponema sp.]